MTAIYWLAGMLLFVSSVLFALAYQYGAGRWPLRRQSWLRVGQGLIALSLLGAVAAVGMPRAWSPRLPYLQRALTRGVQRLEDPDGASLRPTSIASERQATTVRAPTPRHPRRWPTMWLLLWAGFALGSMRLAWHALTLRRLIARATPIRRYRRVRVHVSSETAIPFSVRLGHRAHVVLPVSVLQHRHDLRAALHHEIQHHRNGDTVWILAMEILKISFFWNPAIYLWARQMAQLLELACDEAVVTGKPLGSRDYGYCLLRVAQSTLDSGQRVFLGTAGMSTRACGKSFLMRRIEMLTTYRKNNSRRSHLAALGVGLGLMVGLVAYAGAAVIRGDGPTRLPAVNPAIQKIALGALQAGIKQSRAQGAFAMVGDPRTGQILAVAYAGDARDAEQQIVRYLSEPREPWSLIKPLVAAMAIDAGKTTLDEEHDAGNGRLDIGNKMYTDHEKFAKITTAQMIIQSSTIGGIRVAQKLGAEPLAAAFQTLGFGPGGTAVGFPSALPGELPAGDAIHDVQYVAGASFGFGVRLTPLELVQAYEAIADGGTLLKPQEYRAGDASPIAIRRVMSTETASAMRGVLAKAVEEGTGRRAALTGYKAAGKTATGGWQHVKDGSANGKDKTDVATFIGFAPASDPRVVIYVNVENPKRGERIGGYHAAPIFREIARATLAEMGVPPEK